MSRDILERPAPPTEIRAPYGDQPSQFGDLWLPAGEGPHPVAVVIHGGFWRARYSLDHIGHLCLALRARGIAVWSIEYRRIGQEGGGWPGTLRDAAAALDHLRILAQRYPLDLDRIVSVGHSAGGHLALWLAARHRIAADSPLFVPDPLPLHGAVALAGVVDLQMAWDLRLSDGVVADLLGGTPQEVPERYAAASPRALVPFGVPQVLVHGTADEPVHFDLSRCYAEAALPAGDPVSFVILEGADHFAVIDPQSAVWPTVEAAILSLFA